MSVSAPMSAHTLVGFCLASIVLIEIPGPSLLFALGRALTVGRREALLSVLGNACGLLVQVAAVAVGLGAVVAASASAFTVLRSSAGSTSPISGCSRSATAATPAPRWR